MKKILAFLMACMLLMSIAPAFAEDGEGTTGETAFAGYTSPAMDGNYGLQHTMKLTDTDRTNLPYDITYKFTVSKEASILSPDPANVVNKEAMVTGAPSIADIVYTTTDVFDEDRTNTKNLVFNWNENEKEVEFYEPGVYYWKVEKTAVYTDGGNPDKPTNLRENNNLYVTVTDENGVLTVKDVKLVQITDQEQKAKGSIEDQFPATEVNLILSKTVGGTQGSKNQYFKFNVSVQLPAGYNEMTYVIEGAHETIPATPYNKEMSGLPTTITAKSSSSDSDDSVALWLKHGDSVTIKGLPYGTAVTIVEESNGYSIATEKDVNGVKTKADDVATVSIDGMTADTSVTYTNTKNAQVPTGIDLQTGAPIMGLLAAAALMVLLFVGKRKEAAE